MAEFVRRMKSNVLAGFYERTRSARRIVVVDLGFLGDSVLLVPALWEIRRHYPLAELHTISAPVGAEVLRMAGCVNQAWAFPLGDPSPSWWQHWEIIRALRAARFDLAFNFSGADRTVFLTRLTGARWRVAHQGARKHFWGRWLIPMWVSRVSRDEPVYEQRRQVLRNLGLKPEPVRFDLRIPPDARGWAEANIPARGIHLSINASTHLKEWPLEHWIELGNTLLRRFPDRPLIATASAKPREQARLEALAQGLANPRVLAVCPPPTLPQLAALLARCAVHIGADSGVLHLALATGLRTVAIFRDYPGTVEWLPPGPNHRHVTRCCACADHRLIRTECAARAECLGQILPEKVERLTAELLLGLG